MKIDKKRSKPRNPLHDHPLLRRGALHEKSSKAKRMDEKRKMKKEWCLLMTFKLVLLVNVAQQIQKQLCFYGDISFRGALNWKS